MRKVPFLLATGKAKRYAPIKLIMRTFSLFRPLSLCGVALAASASWSPAATAEVAPKRPNIVVIVTDDHSYQTLGTCEKDSPMPYPHFHQLAKEGMVFDRSYCANSLCGPSRACIYTGRHSHRNGYLFNELAKPFDGSQPTFPKMLQKAGYQTAMVGKWHLESDPTGFDYWEIFPGQGNYFNPDFITPGKDGKNVVKREPGYATELVTKKSIDWLDKRDKSKPFMIVVGHKAPHRCWCPSIQNLGKAKKYAEAIEPPANLHDDFSDRPEFLKMTEQTLLNHFNPWSDEHLIKDAVPKELRPMLESPESRTLHTHYDWDMPEWVRMNPEQKAAWRAYHLERTNKLVEEMRSGKIKTRNDMLLRRWRHYVEDYLGTVLSVDESVGELMDYLKKNGLEENTLVLYCGDQGFYMGEHGLYDKRWIFEESFRMPLIMKWKGHIKPGVRSNAMVQELDYAPTFCEVAGADTPENMATFQGKSLTPLFATGEAPSFTDRPLYYAFYENPGEHNAPRHDGLRTDRYTFSYLWTSDEWMLFDNEKDPAQMHNVYGNPAYAKTVEELKKLYRQLRKDYQVPDGFPGATGKLSVEPQWNVPNNCRQKEATR